MYTLFTLLLFLAICANQVTTIIVNTSYGSLRGYSRQISGSTVHFFKGIPLAEPPVGKLRFQLPRPPKPWEGVLNVTEYSAACLVNSSTSSSPQKTISEDCLYVNIFTSQRCIDSPCPVFFYLHGGMLNYDSAVMYNETFIAEKYASKDVVFVLPAMRLGVFGLLALEDDTLVPKNLALYDMVAGLSYTNREISFFGGDPTRVTIAGHSMGGAVALMLAFSKTIDPERRLFQKAIALSPAVKFQSEQGMKNKTYELIKLAGCPSGPSSETLSCLQSKDGLELLAIQRSMEDDDKVFQGVVFGPPLTDGATTIKEFQQNPPVRDLLIGSTLLEFGIFDDLEDTEVGQFIGLKHTEELREKYLSDEKKAKEEGHPFLSYQSQVIFVAADLYGRKMTEAGGVVYLSEYQQPPNPKHSNDLPFIIGAHPREFTKDEEYIDSIYSQHLVNFTKYGKPNDVWLPFDPSQRNYYSIRADIASGIYPENKLNYHPHVIDYWTRKMAQFDDLLNATERAAGLIDSLSFTSANIWTYVALVGIFVIGMFAIIVVASSKPPHPGPEGRPLL